MLHKAMLAALTVLLALIPTADVQPAAPVPIGKVVQTESTMVLLTIGDSRSVTGIWQNRLCQNMATYAGITCDLRNEAVGSTNCEYWMSRIQGLLVEHNPDAVILACGTNNDATTAAGRTSLGTAFRTVMETAYAFRTSPRIKLFPVLIQYSDYLAPESLQWLTVSEPLVNDTIYQNSLFYSPAGWFPGGFINWQGIPGTPPYLKDPVHPSERGEQYMGDLAYQEIAPGLGWPASTSPITCDLNGGRRPYGRWTGPQAVPCLGPLS